MRTTILLGNSIAISRRRRYNRYFMFRNTDRLRALKRFNFLFGFLSVLAGLAVFVAVIAFFIWLLMTILTLGQATKNSEDVLKIVGIVLIAAVAIIAISITVRFLIERVYIRAERKELYEVPEGAEKYLKVMETNRKVTRNNVLAFAAIVVVVAAVYLIGGVNQTTSIISAVAAVAAAVAVAILNRKEFGKIKDEVNQIKAERRENKKLMID